MLVACYLHASKNSVRAPARCFSEPTDWHAVVAAELAVVESSQQL